MTETPDPKHGERFKQWMASGTGDPTPAIPAATVILLRDAADGIETLMLRRNSKLAFGGMWVFPGGRVEESDGAGLDDEFAAARRAAVREAEEESGLVARASTTSSRSRTGPRRRSRPSGSRPGSSSRARPRAR